MIILCPECQKEISDQAKSCPHCGYPIKKRFAGIKAFGWIILSLFVWNTFFTVYNAISQWILFPLGAAILNLNTTLGSIIFIIVLFGISATVSLYLTLVIASIFNRTKTQAIISASIVAFLCVTTLIFNVNNPVYWGVSIFSVIVWYVVAYKKGKEGNDDFIPSVPVILITIGVCIAANIIVGAIGAHKAEKEYEESLAAYEESIQEEIAENEYNYILNTSSGIFHSLDCPYAPKPQNGAYQLSHKSYGELVNNDGYRPCEHCLLR